MQAEQGVHARRQLSGAEAHIADLEARVAALRATKADLEAQVRWCWAGCYGVLGVLGEIWGFSWCQR